MTEERPVGEIARDIVIAEFGEPLGLIAQRVSVRFATALAQERKRGDSYARAWRVLRSMLGLPESDLTTDGRDVLDKINALLAARREGEGT